MVTHYKCRKIGCKLYGVEIPHIRCLRTLDGKGRICSACESKMVQAKTINVSAAHRESRRTPSRSVGRTPARPAKKRVKKRVSSRSTGRR